MFSINYITNIRHKKKTIETIVLALNRIEKTEKKTQMSLHLSKILYNIIPSQIKKKRINRQTSFNPKANRQKRSQYHNHGSKFKFKNVNFN